MGKYEVMVEGAFSASHQLRMDDGLLEPMHGHQWRVQVCYAGGQLDQIDVLIDFVEVRKRLDDILAGFRDRHLNDLPCFGQTNPSAENVARGIFESLRNGMDAPALLRRVSVWETPTCAATYAEGD